MNITAYKNVKKLLNIEIVIYDEATDFEYAMLQPKFSKTVAKPLPTIRINFHSF